MYLKNHSFSEGLHCENNNTFSWTVVGMIFSIIIATCSFCDYLLRFIRAIMAAVCDVRVDSLLDWLLLKICKICGKHTT